MKFKREQYVMLNLDKVDIDKGNLLYESFVESNKGKALQVQTTRTNNLSRPIGVAAADGRLSFAVKESELLPCDDPIKVDVFKLKQIMKNTDILLSSFDDISESTCNYIDKNFNKGTLEYLVSFKNNISHTIKALEDGIL